MKNLPLVNAAIFFAIAALHADRLFHKTPVSFGSVEIPIWLSALAIVGAALLAWLNWQAIQQPKKAKWLKFLLALFVIDALIVFFSWQLGASYWGISGSQFAWILLFDLLVIGFIHWALKKK